MMKSLNKAKKLAKTFFKVNNQPLELSNGQAEIFSDIFFRVNLRSEVICPTQYGKSLTVACAVLLRAVSCQESFTILAPTEKKARITMNYVIEHAFDHPIFYSQLELEGLSSLERLKRERSKNKITFKQGGGVQILTLDSRNSRKSMEAAMGFGGNRIIVDEAALIEDRLMSSVIRMLGGYEYPDTYLMKIGNPFYRNHFLKTWKGTRYHKIFIDYEQALEEGRYSQDFIEEMRDEAFFDVYYECKFPSEDSIDADGYRKLITETEFDNMFTDQDQNLDGARVGADIGGGGDKNVFMARKGDFAKIMSENQSKDTMVNIGVMKDLREDIKTSAKNFFIDDTGIGKGLTDRCKEISELAEANPITLGSRAEKHDRYINLRAENYFKLRKWIKDGGKIAIKDKEKFKDILEVKYKKDSSDRIKIEPKEEMKKRIGKSPDELDALMLTFSPQETEADFFTI